MEHGMESQEDEMVNELDLKQYKEAIAIKI